MGSGRFGAALSSGDGFCAILGCVALSSAGSVICGHSSSYTPGSAAHWVQSIRAFLRWTLNPNMCFLFSLLNSFLNTEFDWEFSSSFVDEVVVDDGG